MPTQPRAKTPNSLSIEPLGISSYERSELRRWLGGDADIPYFESKLVHLRTIYRARSSDPTCSELLAEIRSLQKPLKQLSKVFSRLARDVSPERPTPTLTTMAEFVLGSNLSAIHRKLDLKMFQQALTAMLESIRHAEANPPVSPESHVSAQRRRAAALKREIAQCVAKLLDEHVGQEISSADREAFLDWATDKVTSAS